MKEFSGQPNVVQLEEALPAHGAAIFEYCNQGDLFDFIIDAKDLKLSERQILSILGDILKGVKAIQEKGWIHRDISLENIFLTKEEDRLRAKIGDLENAERCENAEADRFYGTEKYSAPEKFLLNRASMLQKTNDPRAFFQAQDMWSVGCVIYCLMARSELPWGTHPDRARQFLELLSQKPDLLTFVENSSANLNGTDRRGHLLLCHARPVFSPFFPLLKGLLTVDPAKRLTIDQAIEQFDRIVRTIDVDKTGEEKSSCEDKIRRNAA